MEEPSGGEPYRIKYYICLMAPTPQVPNVTGIFLTGNSFVGDYTIPVSDSANIILQNLIDKWERKYIMQLLGVELGKLLIAYHNSSDPPDQRYDDIIAPFDLQDTLQSSMPFSSFNKIHSSLGIEDMLAAFIYYHYTLSTQAKNTQSGFAIPNVETASVMSPLGASKEAEARWNNALQTSDAIQWFCMWKTDDTTHENIYPEFAGWRFAPQYTSTI